MLVRCRPAAVAIARVLGMEPRGIKHVEVRMGTKIDADLMEIVVTYLPTVEQAKAIVGAMAENIPAPAEGAD